MQILMIDMGHSSVDPLNGKKSPDNTFHEWSFNRKLGRALIEELKKRGYDARPVVYENEDNKKISLTERVRRTNAVCDKVGTKNVLFISIHANAAGNGQWMKARGWSAYVSKNCSQASKDLAGCIFDGVATQGFKMRQPLPGQKYWQENFTVITKTKCKAVLTESLFYDNKEDLEILKSEDGFRRLLQGHVDGIIEYLTKHHT